jgi:hypothetical protein
MNNDKKLVIPYAGVENQNTNEKRNDKSSERPT